MKVKIYDPQDPDKKARIIRMRMTLRGLKDKEAEGLVTYAGASSRPSQRLIASEAVIRGWPLTTIDVRKAFLKGLTYKELAEPHLNQRAKSTSSWAPMR